VRCMFGFDAPQRKAMGLDFILGRLSPASPYGAEKIKAMHFLSPQELAQAFDNIQTAMAHPRELEELRGHLASLKNIRGSIAKAVLTQVDFFEVKHFLITYEKLLPAFKQFNFSGIELHPMEDALAIVDPRGLRVAAFVVESPELSQIRKEKLRAEAGDPHSEERRALVEREDAEEAKVLREMSGALQAHIPLFLANLEHIGALDFTLAKAKLAAEYNANRPKISDRGVLSYTRLANPYMAHALKHQPLTKISLTLSTAVTVITGANMGGKSVAIKSVVLNTLLCRLGFFVFADCAEVPLFDGICLISEDMQDVNQGLSSFGAEIARLHEIVHRGKKEFLLIALDELARGTNPTEGEAIVKAVANYLAKTGCLCLMATHYNQVAKPGFAHYQVKGLSFTAPGAAYMDYHLIEAPHDAPTPRDALHICKTLGLDGDLLEEIQNEYRRLDL